MKSRENLLRLKHFQVEDKTRQLTQIDLMIGEFEKMFGDLQAQIDIEEEKAGITDPSHFAYPTFAKAARQRQENLKVSIEELTEKRVNAEAALKDTRLQLALSDNGALDVRASQLKIAADVEKMRVVGSNRLRVDLVKPDVHASCVGTQYTHCTLVLCLNRRGGQGVDIQPTQQFVDIHCGRAKKL